MCSLTTGLLPLYSRKPPATSLESVLKEADFGGHDVLPDGKGERDAVGRLLCGVDEVGWLPGGERVPREPLWEWERNGSRGVR